VPRSIEELEKWDKRFIHLAKHFSSWSKDPSTQVGAVIFDSDYRIVSVGYNGLAAGVADVLLDNRDRKIMTIIHAEMNAILFSNQKLKGCTLATWPFMPCSNCSSVIIQSGISRCIFPKATGDKALRWKDSFDLAKEQFEEVGVILKEYEDDFS